MPVLAGYEIRSLRQDDAAALAAAYRRNREHLEPWEPRRPEGFFTEVGQRQDVARQLEDLALGKRHSFVLWYDDRVVGRVNVDNIVRGVLQSATLGYWVDREQTGRGLATAMVAYAVAHATALGLHRLEAGTLLHNTASQSVLRRSGFRAYGVAERFLFIEGRWQDHALFQRILHDGPPGNPRPGTGVPPT